MIGLGLDFLDFVHHLYKYITVQVHRNSFAFLLEYILLNINNKNKNVRKMWHRHDYFTR